MCKTTLFFPENFHNIPHEKVFLRKNVDSDFGKQKKKKLENFLLKIENKVKLFRHGRKSSNS